MERESELIRRISGNYERLDLPPKISKIIPTKLKPYQIILFGAKHSFPKGNIKRKILEGNLENKSKTINKIKLEIEKNAKKYATQEQANYREIFFSEPSEIKEGDESNYIQIFSEIQLYINNPHYPCKGEELVNKLLTRELKK